MYVFPTNKQFDLMKHELTFYSICTLNTSIHSRADRCNIWKNCAFDDKSLKLCTQSKNTLKNILGYRDIIDLSYEKNGSLFFSKWPPFFKMTAKNSDSQHRMMQGSGASTT